MELALLPEDCGRWQLPLLAFALSQHPRVGWESPAHVLPHDVVREVLQHAGCTTRLTHQALLLCIGGVSDPSVHRDQLADTEGLLLAASSRLERHYAVRGLPALRRPRACHVAAWSPTSRSVVVVGGRSADEMAPTELCEQLQCPDIPLNASAAGASALSGWDWPEVALSSNSWNTCPVPPVALRPKSGWFGPTAGTPRERAGAVTLLDGTIMVMGGLGARLETLCECWLYDPAAPDAAVAWRAAAPMAHARCDFGFCRLCDGTVLVAGGVDNGSRLRSAEVYSPETNSWQPTGSLGQPRRGCSLAALPTTLGGGAIAVGGSSVSTAGGRSLSTVVLRSCERLYVAGHQLAVWRPSWPLVSARHFAAVVVFGSCVLVLGGNDGKNHLRSIEIAQLNALAEAPSSDRHCASSSARRQCWELLPEEQLSLQVPRSQFAVVVI